jgi:hypothetical protein
VHRNLTVHGRGLDIDAGSRYEIQQLALERCVLVTARRARARHDVQKTRAIVEQRAG